MKIISSIGLAALMCVSAQAQVADDPVVMTINGNDITRSAFEYSFNKNNADGVIDKKGVEDYAQLFINFKLKVEAAKDAGIDTIASVRRELYSYKEQMVVPTLVDQNYIEREARTVYDATAQQFGGEDLLTTSHILVLMRQDATPDEENAAKARIDSIYTALKGGADFAALAVKHSDDKASAVNGGRLNQFGRGMMIPDFEQAAYALKAGEMSKPVKSTVGWHIIKMEDRHPFESYEFHHDNIIAFLERRGIREASANAFVDSIARETGVDRSEVIDDFYKKMVATDSEALNLGQEYYDGTLMYEICKTQIWDEAARDDKGLTEYFNQHKKEYTWDEPRFRGMLIRAKDAATLKKAKALIKGVEEQKWAQTITSTLNNDSVKIVRAEYSLYTKGTSKAIDKFAFKSKEEVKPMKDFPVMDVVGKVLKSPETYKDVKGQVTADYQAWKEQQWVESLRKKYSFTINEEVLKTVNNH